MTEDEFSDAVVDLGHVFGWHTVGHRPMRTKHGWATGWRYDGEGWPDLTMIHPDRGIILCAELKTATGRLRDQQTVWATRLQQTSHNATGPVTTPIRYRLWRPDDWPAILNELSDGKATRP